MKISKLIKILNELPDDADIISLGVDSSGYSHQHGPVNLVVYDSEKKKLELSHYDDHFKEYGSGKTSLDNELSGYGKLERYVIWDAKDE